MVGSLDKPQFCFNPRLPGGRRRTRPVSGWICARFQSTPSGGKATGKSRVIWTSRVPFQSTPSGGKATSTAAVGTVRLTFQSTPSGGKATSFLLHISTTNRFQSTPSGGKATGRQPPHPTQLWGFNPRLPGGRRPPRAPQRARRRLFQSTPSGGKATLLFPFDADADPLVSIHAFRGEGDGTSCV